MDRSRSNKPAPRCLRALLLSLLIPTICACSINYLDGEGNRRIIGLVNLKLDTAEGDAVSAGDKIELSNIGIMLFNSPVHGGISLGYSRESFMMLKNDALVILDNNNVATQEEGIE